MNELYVGEQTVCVKLLHNESDHWTIYNNIYMVQI